MNFEKFKIETETLKKFYELYCNDKHDNLKIKKYNLEYKNQSFNIELNLCDSCHEGINYSFERLKGCPHDIKPRCRRCPTPCYEKDRWKNIAKIMKYSAIKLSLGKIKSKVMNIFN